MLRSGDNEGQTVEPELKAYWDSGYYTNDLLCRAWGCWLLSQSNSLARLNCGRILRLISHRTAFLKLFAFERIAFRLEIGPSCSFVRSMLGQKRIICLTDWLGSVYLLNNSIAGIRSEIQFVVERSPKNEVYARCILNNILICCVAEEKRVARSMVQIDSSTAASISPTRPSTPTPEPVQVVVYIGKLL